MGFKNCSFSQKLLLTIDWVLFSRSLFLLLLKITLAKCAGNFWMCAATARWLLCYLRRRHIRLSSHTYVRYRFHYAAIFCRSLLCTLDPACGCLVACDSSNKIHRICYNSLVRSFTKKAIIRLRSRNHIRTQQKIFFQFRLFFSFGSKKVECVTTKKKFSWI